MTSLRGTVVVSSPGAPPVRATAPGGGRVLVAPGVQGPPGHGVNLAGAVATYADLPVLTSSDAGKAFMVQEDGRLYVWSGVSWPVDGDGAQFRGEKGDQGRGIEVVSVDGDDLVLGMTDGSTVRASVPALAAAVAARDAAVAARADAVSARTATETARDDAVAARDGAVTANTSATDAAAKAKTSETAAGKSATAAAADAGRAESARTGAASARDGAVAARTSAEGARDGAVAAGASAADARDGAVAAAQAAQAAQAASAARPAMWVWDGTLPWTAPAEARPIDTVLNTATGEIHAIVEVTS